MSERSVFVSESSRLWGSRNRVAAGALIVLAAGYVLGSVLRPERVFEEVLGPFHNGAGSAQGAAAFLPATVAALAFFAVLFGLSKVAPWRRSPFAGRVEKPIGQFVLEAEQTGLGLRVSREAYDLLRHHYPRPMCIELSDDLQRDLRMTSGEILSVRAGLLARTDRLERNDDVGRLTTVRRLLESVEAAPKNGVDRATMRQRVTDLPLDPRPVVENLEFTEKSSLADPDFLRRAHFKWVRRRDADYSGFRSRESDNASGKSHAGPFRRATELSRRLAVKREAGRLAKLAAEKRAAEDADLDSWMPPFAGQDKRGEDIAHHGY